MIDRQTFEDKYGKIMSGFFAHQEEKSFFDVSQLCKELVLSRLGPDVLIDVHTNCLKRIINDLDPMTISRMVVTANDVLLNGMMAYAMNYYNFLELLDVEKNKTEQAGLEVVEERNKLDDIISSIDADLLLLDRDMKILWVNKRLRERHPYVKGDVTGHLCNKAYCNIEEVPGDCPAAIAFKTGLPVRQEHPITHPDGTTRFYHFTCSPVKDIEGNFTHVLELVQDITDEHVKDETLKTKTAELEKKNLELDRFNKLFVDREFRIKELKERVKELEKK